MNTSNSTRTSSRECCCSGELTYRYHRPRYARQQRREHATAPSLPYVRTERRRRPGLVLAAALLALTTVALTDAPSPTRTAGPPQSQRAAAPVLAGLAPDAPMPTPAGVARALAGPLADAGLGGTAHVEVVDALTGRVLLDQLGGRTDDPGVDAEAADGRRGAAGAGPSTAADHARRRQRPGPLPRRRRRPDADRGARAVRGRTRRAPT